MEDYNQTELKIETKSVVCVSILVKRYKIKTLILFCYLNNFKRAACSSFYLKNKFILLTRK